MRFALPLGNARSIFPTAVRISGTSSRLSHGASSTASGTPFSTEARPSLIAFTIALFELSADDEPRRRIALALLYARAKASTVTFGRLS